MPWAYPTIPGQSSGGQSVDPIPDPNLPYDFTEAVFSINRTNTTYYLGDNQTRVDYFIKVSGVKIKDTSNVTNAYVDIDSSVATISPSTINGEGYTLNNVQSFRVSDPNNSTLLVYGMFSTANSGTECTLSGDVKLKINISGSDGLLQTYEVVIS